MISSSVFYRVDTDPLRRSSSVKSSQYIIVQYLFCSLFNFWKNLQYLIHTDRSPKNCCSFLAIGLLSVWKFSKKCCLFLVIELISVWRFSKKMLFFWLLDLYRYGNFPKKCCFFLAIGLLSVWKFPKKNVFFGCWIYIGLVFYRYGLGTHIFSCFCKVGSFQQTFKNKTLD